MFWWKITFKDGRVRVFRVYKKGMQDKWDYITGMYGGDENIAKVEKFEKKPMGLTGDLWD